MRGSVLVLGFLKVRVGLVLDGELVAVEGSGGKSKGTYVGGRVASRGAHGSLGHPGGLVHVGLESGRVAVRHVDRRSIELVA